ncbi:hypothetical protein DFJ73DRAFT_771838 [Zopfochytrium polystomum]|nr:hypothetical protein DFJ73DRAFT_771838 [Zopfochytrium polystomum]
MLTFFWISLTKYAVHGPQRLPALGPNACLRTKQTTALSELCQSDVVAEPPKEECAEEEERGQRQSEEEEDAYAQEQRTKLARAVGWEVQGTLCDGVGRSVGEGVASGEQAALTETRVCSSPRKVIIRSRTSSRDTDGISSTGDPTGDCDPFPPQTFWALGDNASSISSLSAAADAAAGDNDCVVVVIRGIVVQLVACRPLCAAIHQPAAEVTGGLT